MAGRANHMPYEKLSRGIFGSTRSLKRIYQLVCRDGSGTAGLATTLDYWLKLYYLQVAILYNKKYCLGIVTIIN